MSKLLLCEDNDTTARRIVAGLADVADDLTVVVSASTVDAMNQIAQLGAEDFVCLDSSMPKSPTDTSFDNRAGARICAAIRQRGI